MKRFEKPGYSKYDYCNKETDNSRNGHSKEKVADKIKALLMEYNGEK